MRQRLWLKALTIVIAASSVPRSAPAAGPLRAVTLKKPPGPGRLFPPGAETVKVYLMDERTEMILSLGFDGGEETPSGFYGYWTRVPNGAAGLFESAARDAVEALGMRWGTEGQVVTVLTRDLRIQHFNRPGEPVHFAAYGRFQAILKSGDGQDLRTEDLRLAGHAVATASPDEALSGLLARMAWETTVRALLAYFPRKPDPEAVARLLTALDSRDPALRARAAFWLGFAGGDEVAQKLTAVLRREEDPGAFEAAAESLARIRSPQGREEIADVLSGKVKWKGVDPARIEFAWALLHALALYGDSDLASRVPASKDLRGRLTDLVRFESTGQPPALSPAEVEGRTRGMAWITGKK